MRENRPLLYLTERGHSIKRLDRFSRSQRSPMALYSVDWLVVTTCTLLSLWLWTRSRRVSRFPHPPGPRGLPLLGNLLDVPSPQGFPWETYRQWSHQYGVSVPNNLEPLNVH